MIEDYDIFHLFYHMLDTKHLIYQVSLKSNKAKGALSGNNYLNDKWFKVFR